MAALHLHRKQHCRLLAWEQKQRKVLVREVTARGEGRGRSSTHPVTACPPKVLRRTEAAPALPQARLAAPHCTPTGDTSIRPAHRQARCRLLREQTHRQPGPNQRPPAGYSSSASPGGSLASCHPFQEKKPTDANLRITLNS